MKTKSDLEQLAKSAGGTLEEDTDLRDMRTFQIVAPDGKRWSSGPVVCVRVDWAKGSTRHAVAHNESEYKAVKEILDCGLEEIPAEEADLYASDFAP